MRLLLFCLSAMCLSGPVWGDDVFATRTLRVGAIIAAQDVKSDATEDDDVIARMIGQEVRRAVYAGHRVTSGHLGPPTLVRRNEIVSMSYKVGGLGIRTEGRALAQGGFGEVVEVMNLSSRLTVRATVSGLRQVEVQR